MSSGLILIAILIILLYDSNGNLNVIIFVNFNYYPVNTQE